MKKVVLSVGVGLVLFLSGCSSKSSEPKYTATFIDAAVAGVDYKCGNTKTKTDSKGQFTCPFAKTVTFSIGDLKLLEFDPNNSKVRKNDKGEIAIFVKEVVSIETAKKVSALLLTLDSDGNPDNGISLPKEAPEIIKEVMPNTSDISTVDVDSKVAEIVNKAIEKTGGDKFTPKTTTDAETHLDDVEEEVKKDFPKIDTKVTGGEG